MSENQPYNIIADDASSSANTNNINKTQTWEACKENVLPIKRGRSVKGLGESLQHRPASDNSLETQEKAFETRIAAATADEGTQGAPSGVRSASELLEVYIQYYGWTRDAFPSSSDKALRLLEVSGARVSVRCDLCVSSLSSILPLNRPSPSFPLIMAALYQRPQGGRGAQERPALRQAVDRVCEHDPHPWRDLLVYAEQPYRGARFAVLDRVGVCGGEGREFQAHRPDFPKGHS